MSRKILVTDSDGPSLDFIEAAADNEFELQEVLLNNPQLLPAEDLGIDGDLLVVGRETTLASGYVDLLCLSKGGEVVIVEFKTGPQNPDFRAALAQVIDYGSDLWKLDGWASFDEGVVHRYLKGPYVDSRFKGCSNLQEAAARGWNLAADQWEQLTARLDEVLATGDFHFVVAAQRFADPMRTAISYLNEVTTAGKYFLVEVIRLDGASQKAYAAQVAQRPEIRRAQSRRSSTKATEGDFLAGVTDPDYREALSELFATVDALGLKLQWGAKGASVQLKTPDALSPLSVGWVFLEGDGWTWARHVTLGVDPNSVAAHPTVETEIEAYCRRVAQVPGGRPASVKANATIFDPPTFTAHRAELLEALSELTESLATG